MTNKYVSCKAYFLFEYQMDGLLLCVVNPIKVLEFTGSTFSDLNLTL